MPTQIVKRAGAAFNQGDYRTAKQLYQQAAAQYGHHLFTANLDLCDKALQGGKLTATVEVNAVSQHRQPERASGGAIDQQLSETQRLLEHYFTRCQQLEHQLMDR